MHLKRKMEITFDDSEVLQNLINGVYFSHKNGKKNVYNKQVITLNKEDINYRILSNLNYNIKLSSELIDGHMMFKMEEQKENECIILYPESVYCIEKEGKYVFY